MHQGFGLSNQILHKTDWENLRMFDEYRVVSSLTAEAGHLSVVSLKY